VTHLKTAKITKRWQLGDVLVGSITFFGIFAVLDVSLFFTFLRALTMCRPDNLQEDSLYE